MFCHMLIQIPLSRNCASCVLAVQTILRIPIPEAKMGWGYDNLCDIGGQPLSLAVSSCVARPQVHRPKRQVQSRHKRAGGTGNWSEAAALWMWVKNRYPKWNPAKWIEGKPAVPWWFYFGPYPCVSRFPHGRGCTQSHAASLETLKGCHIAGRSAWRLRSTGV